MKINEILSEAGLGKAIGTGILKAAKPFAKMFDPATGKAVQKAIAGAERFSDANKEKSLQKTQDLEKIAKSATPGYAPKPLSAFSQILPKHVSVTRRNPLVIRYGTQDFTYDELARRWENIKGDAVKDVKLGQLLTSWAEEINDFDPVPEPVKPSPGPAVFASGRQVASVKTSYGTAVKMRDGKWYVGKTPITDVEDIAKLDQEARVTGQIK